MNLRGGCRIPFLFLQVFCVALSWAVYNDPNSGDREICWCFINLKEHLFVALTDSDLSVLRHDRWESPAVAGWRSRLQFLRPVLGKSSPVFPSAQRKVTKVIAEVHFFNSSEINQYSLHLQTKTLNFRSLSRREQEFWQIWTIWQEVRRLFYIGLSMSRCGFIQALYSKLHYILIQQQCFCFPLEVLLESDRVIQAWQWDRPAFSVMKIKCLWQCVCIREKQQQKKLFFSR